MTLVTKKKQEDKNLEVLKKLLKICSNKKCFECNERFPTYIDITIGSFVCSACSGILRGLSTPHRLKSISMSCFTQSEIALMETRGNEYCRKVYLGNYDPRCKAKPETSANAKLKVFMEQKYEEKRWYVAPQELNQPLESFKNTSANQSSNADSKMSVSNLPVKKNQVKLNHTTEKSNSSILDAVFNENNSGFADFNSAFSTPSNDPFQTNVIDPSVHVNKNSSSGFSYGDSSSVKKTAPVEINSPIIELASNETADKYDCLIGLFDSSFSPNSYPTPSQNSLLSTPNNDAFNASSFPSSSIPISSASSSFNQPQYNTQQQTNYPSTSGFLMNVNQSPAMTSNTGVKPRSSNIQMTPQHPPAMTSNAGGMNHLRNIQMTPQYPPAMTTNTGGMHHSKNAQMTPQYPPAMTANTGGMHHSNNAQMTPQYPPAMTTNTGGMHHSNNAQMTPQYPPAMTANTGGMHHSNNAQMTPQYPPSMTTNTMHHSKNLQMTPQYSQYTPASTSNFPMMSQPSGPMYASNTANTMMGNQQPSNNAFVSSHVSSSACSLQSNLSHHSAQFNVQGNIPSNNRGFVNSSPFPAQAPLQQQYPHTQTQPMANPNRLPSSNPFYQTTPNQQMLNSSHIAPMSGHTSQYQARPSNPFTAVNNQSANPYF